MSENGKTKTKKKKTTTTKTDNRKRYTDERQILEHGFKITMPIIFRK